MLRQQSKSGEQISDSNYAHFVTQFLHPNDRVDFTTPLQNLRTTLQLDGVFAEIAAIGITISLETAQLESSLNDIETNINQASQGYDALRGTSKYLLALLFTRNDSSAPCSFCSIAGKSRNHGPNGKCDQRARSGQPAFGDNAGTSQ